MSVFVRAPYNYDMFEASQASGLVCPEESLAVQSMKDECDINVIVDRFGLGADMPLNPRMPLTEDFLETVDYRSALDKLREADEAFYSFPAHIRAQFANDPARLCDFVADPANVEKCREWGLARPVEPLRAPLEVRVIPEVPDPSKTS